MFRALEEEIGKCADKKKLIELLHQQIISNRKMRQAIDQKVLLNYINDASNDAEYVENRRHFIQSLFASIVSIPKVNAKAFSNMVREMCSKQSTAGRTMIISDLLGTCIEENTAEESTMEEDTAEDDVLAKFLKNKQWTLNFSSIF